MEKTDQLSNVMETMKCLIDFCEECDSIREWHMDQRTGKSKNFDITRDQAIEIMKLTEMSILNVKLEYISERLDLIENQLIGIKCMIV